MDEEYDTTSVDDAIREEAIQERDKLVPAPHDDRDLPIDVPIGDPTKED